MANAEATEVVDAHAVEEVAPMPAASNQVVAVPAPPPTVAVAPQASAKDLIARLDAIKEAQKDAMEKDVDYGVIPGTDKPTLLKPGAEKLAALFQLDVEPHNEKRWEEDGHLTVVSRVTIFHAPTGARLGSGEGLCTTREKKYGKRTQDRACPNCSAETIKRSKYPPRNNPQAEPGWYCFVKIGGCGANFAADDQAITGQTTGEIDNPDLADLWNTVLKMAKKRGFVDAVLAVTGASAVFTQDVEDDQPSPDTERPPVEQQPAKAEPKVNNETVRKLGSYIGALALSYAEVHHVLGACGANGLTGESKDALRQALEGLTLEQGPKVETQLEKMAKDRGVELPQLAQQEQSGQAGGQR